MQSSLAVHLILAGPPLPFEHALVVDRSMPVLDLLAIAQLHLGRAPDTTAVLQVGDRFHAADFDDPIHGPGFTEPGKNPTPASPVTVDPGNLTVGDLRNSPGPVRLLISELDGWVFDLSLRTFDGEVPARYYHPDFPQGFIPAPGTSTFQLANFQAPDPTPNRQRELSRFRVAAKYEPELSDVSWELYIAMAMQERGLAVSQLSTLLHFTFNRPHWRVLHTIARDLTTQHIPIGSQGYPPLQYVRGLVAQAPDLIEQSFLVSNPEHIKRAREVSALPGILRVGEQLGLFTGVDESELQLTAYGESLTTPVDGRTEASARFTVELALWLAEEAGVTFPSSSPKPEGLAEVIDFQDYRAGF